MDNIQETSTKPIEKPTSKQDKLREIWLKDRQKRKGQAKKVRVGLGRKLFLMVVALIAGLLGVVYTMTLADEERVLRRELEIRGGTVARNLADSIYNSYANLVQEKNAKPFDIFVFDPKKPNKFAPVQFSDAIKKASEQQDFVTGYALDPKNRAFVHSANTKYLFSMKTPEGVFDFKAIYPIKLYLEKRLEKQKTKISALSTEEQQILQQLISFRTELRLFHKKDEKLDLFIKKTNNDISLIAKDAAKTKEIKLNISNKELTTIGKLSLALIRQDYTEMKQFLKNSISELRKIRRTATLIQDKTLIKKAFDRLETMLDRPHVFKAELTAMLPTGKALLDQLKDKTIKNECAKIQLGLANQLKRFNPIVQIYSRQLSEKLSEEILYITYPMCETDKYFRTYRGEVHLLLSQQGIKYTINYAKEKLQFAALLAIAVGTLFTIIMAFFITSPIKKLMAAMRRVGTGDLDQTVIVRASDEIGVLADNFNEMTEGLREKERIRSAMNKAVSKEVAEVMLSGELKLGGDNKNITVLFSDIRSFTTLSEKLSPEEVVDMLNEYMTIMTNIVEKHRGIVDKFVGDEIMALWGAPKSYGNDAIAAVKAALDMMVALNQFNDKRRAAGQMAIDIGIGLNTGEVIAGNMGSENRMNYTVIGDNVNLGARLEGTNKMYGTHIIISEYTYREIKELIYARELDLIRVKGKNEPVSIYEVMGLTTEGDAIRTTKE